MTSKWITILSLVIYVFVIGLLTIYYGHNFSKFVHYKGDEFNYYVIFLLTSSAIFNLFISQTTKILSLKFGLLTTVFNGFISLILGFIFWTVTEIDGIPRQLIFIYGGCYLLVLSSLTIFKVIKYQE